MENRDRGKAVEGSQDVGEGIPIRIKQALL